MKKSFLIAIFSIALICFLGVNTPTAKAATVEELQTQIKALLAQIASLQQELAEIRGGAVWCYDFNVNLRVEMQGAKVRALQTALQKEGFEIPVSETENEGYFGDFTASAVVQFQEKYASEILTPLGLKHGTGYVGPATRAKLNNLYGCGKIPIKPYITVLSPNGGEKWAQGLTQTIRWSVTNIPTYASFEINLINRTTGVKIRISPNLTADRREYSWTIETHNTVVSDNYIVSIDVVSSEGVMIASDQSNAPFSIVSAIIDSCYSDPSYSGQPGKDIYRRTTTYYKGESKTDYCINSVRLKEYYCSTAMGGVHWLDELEYDCPNGCENGACKQTPSITVLSPNGGEKWEIGKTYEIKWNSYGLSGKYIDIGLNLTNPSFGAGMDITHDVLADLSKYSWTIPSILEGFDLGAVGNKYKIELITHKGDPYAYDFSDNYFSIVAAGTPSITVISPNGGETLTVNSQVTIRWQSSGLASPTVLLEVRKSSSPYIMIYSAAPNTGSYTWTIPTGLVGMSDLKIRVTDQNNRAVFDESDNYFSVVSATTPSITVLSPNGGERWEIGKTYEIKWITQNITWPYTITIDLSKGGEGYVRTLFTNLANDGIEKWTIPSDLASGNDYKITISGRPTGGCPPINNVPCSSYLDISDAPFSIVAASTTCTDSDGGRDYYTKGTATYTGSGTPAQGYTQLTDFCAGGGGIDIRTLREAYCSVDGYVLSENYICPNGCSNGACIKTITVVSPNGGEIWSAGTTQTIKWTPSSSGTVRLEIRKGASPYVMISSCCIPDTGSYAWPVPTGFALASDYRVRVTKNDGAGQYDESDGLFSIVAPTTQPVVGIAAPNTGDIWQMGSTYNIIWFANNFVSSDKVNIILLDGRAGYSYYVIATDVPALAPSGTYAGTPIGTYYWTVPATGIIPGSTNPFKIYIGKYKPPAQSGDWEPLRASAESGVYGYGNNFSIVSASAAPIINDIRPSSILQGQTLQVTLYGYNLGGASNTNGSCGLNPDALGGFVLGNCNIQPLFVSVGITAANNAITGDRQFTITTPSGVSNPVKFTVLSSSTNRNITVTSPNGGETWKTGETHRVTWASQGIDKVAIYIYNDTIPGSGSTNYLDYPTTSLSVPASQGYFDWTIVSSLLPKAAPGNENRYKISIRDVNFESTQIKDESDNYFTISAAATSCTDSDGGKNYYTKGATDDGITIGDDVCDFTILKERYCDAQSKFATESYVCPNGCENGACRKSITVLSPNGGEIWSAGTTQTIKWTPSSSGTVRLEIRKGASPYAMISSCCIPDTGSYAWPVPTGFALASDYRVRVTKNDGAGQYDESDGLFSIVSGGLGMENIENQLASISSAISELMEKIKELTR